MSFILSTHHHLSVLVEVLSSMSSCLVLGYYLGEGNISEWAINNWNIVHASQLHSALVNTCDSLHSINKRFIGISIIRLFDANIIKLNRFIIHLWKVFCIMLSLLYILAFAIKTMMVQNLLLCNLLFVEWKHSPCSPIVIVFDATTWTFTSGHWNFGNLEIIRLKWATNCCYRLSKLIVTGTCFLIWVLKLGGRIFSARGLAPQVGIFGDDRI